MQDQDSRFIQSLKIKNLLSFGSEGVEVDLKPLNIIIGLNGAGKSNLIEAIGLLQAAPKSLADAIAGGGGVQKWLWKGTENPPIAEIEALVVNPEYYIPLRYQLSFEPYKENDFQIKKEYLEDAKVRDPNANRVYFYYRYEEGQPPVINVAGESQERHLKRDEADAIQSVLQQRQDRDLYPELSYLSKQFADVRLYRYWNFKPNEAPRKPQSYRQLEPFLEENGSNLAGVLNELNNIKSKRRNFLNIEKNLKSFNNRFESIQVKHYGTTLELFIKEQGLWDAIPAVRLSEGTLRYLCLLAILCHPDPPPLICLEDPETGLHPDQMPALAELIIKASEKTQIIITTQSDMFLSSFTDAYLNDLTASKSLIVCEHDEKGSHLRQWSREELKDGLEEDSLGGLWMRGLLGGVR